MLKIHNGNILFLTLIASALGFMAGLSAKNAPPSMSVSPLVEVMPIPDRIAKAENLIVFLKDEEDAYELFELLISLAKERSGSELKQKIINHFAELMPKIRKYGRAIDGILYYAILQGIMIEKKIWTNLSEEQFDLLLFSTVGVIWQEKNLIDEAEAILNVLRQLNDRINTTARREHLLNLDCAVSLRKADIDELPNTLNRLIDAHDKISSLANKAGNEKVRYWTNMISRFWKKEYSETLLSRVESSNASKFTKEVIYAYWLSYINWKFNELPTNEINAGLTFIETFIHNEKISHDYILYKQYNQLKFKMEKRVSP